MRTSPQSARTAPERRATIDEELLDCFREDHAVLGRGFYDLATTLRAGQAEEAARIARTLDRQAGSHIAFEEVGPGDEQAELLALARLRGKSLVEHARVDGEEHGDLLGDA